MPADPRAKLIRQLQCAHAGELAAGYAYRGHWHSVREPQERERIREIESDEWHHRELVAGLLRQLGAKPLRLREAVFFCIGKFIAGFCHVGGWFFPMWGAGLLEQHNIVEYEDCAEYASRCGEDSMIDCLLGMAEVEWEHERYFREKASGHWLVRLFRIWTPPAPKETIRAKRERAA